MASCLRPLVSSRRTLVLTALFLFTCVANLAHAQEFNKIVVFGDSLSDTGNVAHLTQTAYGIRIPGLIVDYADGRFTDGIYTSPPAQEYRGVWVEQLAAMLPTHPQVKDSLDGGTDYAYGYATTRNGTDTLAFGPTNAYPVVIEDMGAQITSYLATNPKIHENTLFVVWGGAIDLLHATSPTDIVTAAGNEAADIQRLINAGARNFIVANLPPLGLVPRLNGSPTLSIPATQASALFNQLLAQEISTLHTLNPGKHLKLHELDVYSLLNDVVAHPSEYGFTNVTASSQAMPVVPDHYLFWDDLHPTTHGHHLLALRALDLIDPDACHDHDRHGNGCERSHDHDDKDR